MAEEEGAFAQRGGGPPARRRGPEVVRGWAGGRAGEPAAGGATGQWGQAMLMTAPGGKLPMAAGTGGAAGRRGGERRQAGQGFPRIRYGTAWRVLHGLFPRGSSARLGPVCCATAHAMACCCVHGMVYSPRCGLPCRRQWPGPARPGPASSAASRRGTRACPGGPACLLADSDAAQALAKRHRDQLEMRIQPAPSRPAAMGPLHSRVPSRPSAPTLRPRVARGRRRKGRRAPEKHRRLGPKREPGA
jgi:hypothetical protein